MQIVFVRHGESESNALDGSGKEVFTGQYDFSLTEKGRQQAEALRGNPIFDDVQAVFVSDLLRARQTVAAIFGDNEFVIDPRLRERSLGEFEGRVIKEVIAEPCYAEYFSDPDYIHFRNDFIVKAPGGENYTDVTLRIRSFLNDVRKQNYKKVVIVSHNCAIRCFIKELTGISEQETLALRIRNCDPFILEV